MPMAILQFVFTKRNNKATSLRNGFVCFVTMIYK